MITLYPSRIVELDGGWLSRANLLKKCTVSAFFSEFNVQYLPDPEKPGEKAHI